MATNTRVLVVGPSQRREIRETLEAAGLRVVREVPTPAEIPDDESIEVVLVTDDRLLDEIADGWRDLVGATLVVVTRDERIATALAALGLRGWAMVTPDSPPAHLAAAIVAAASGFAVRPASSERDDAEDEESAPVEALTAREREVLELVSQGLPNKAVAARLGVSDHTVKFHLSSIFSKLGVSTRTEAVRRAVRAGLINF